MTREISKSQARRIALQEGKQLPEFDGMTRDEIRNTVKCDYKDPCDYDHTCINHRTVADLLSECERLDARLKELVEGIELVLRQPKAYDKIYKLIGK